VYMYMHRYNKSQVILHVCTHDVLVRRSLNLRIEWYLFVRVGRL